MAKLEDDFEFSEESDENLAIFLECYSEFSPVFDDDMKVVELIDSHSVAYEELIQRGIIYG